MNPNLARPAAAAAADPALDPARIAAETAAIAVHVIAALLLLAPMKAPSPAAETMSTSIDFLPRARPLPPPPPPPPRQVQIRPTQASPRPAPVARPPVADPPRVFEDAGPVELPLAEPAQEAPSEAPPDLAPSGGAHLEYLVAPPPPYPRDALRQGASGSVILEVHVDEDGRPIDVTVVRSSGHRSLDRAAQIQVLRRWRFRPAMENGRPVPAIGRVPVDFRLDR